VVSPSGTIYIVTKDPTRASAVYRFPRRFDATTTATLERIGTLNRPDKSSNSGAVTDAAVTPNGEHVAVRTHRALGFYRMGDFEAGNPLRVRTIDLASFHEPQGEGVAFANDGRILLAGEGGGKSAPGTFAWLVCTKPRTRSR
jgi:hypothetical protein